MERIVHIWGLSLGLLFADFCLLIPVAIVAIFANSPFMGGSFNESGFLSCMAVALTILVLINVAIELGAFWLRWLLYLALVSLFLGTLVCSPDIFPMVCKWNADSIIPVIILIVGLLLCPLAMLFVAIGVKRCRDLG